MGRRQREAGHRESSRGTRGEGGSKVETNQDKITLATNPTDTNSCDRTTYSRTPHKAYLSWGIHPIRHRVGLPPNLGFTPKSTSHNA
jgi:hypothetical protein